MAPQKNQVAKALLPLVCPKKQKLLVRLLFAYFGTSGGTKKGKAKKAALQLEIITRSAVIRATP